MPNLTFSIGSLTITPLWWCIFLAGFLSSFAIWRRLKEDYPEEDVYKLISTVFVLIVVLWIIGRYLGLGLVSAFLGITLSVFVWSKGVHRNIWEVFDTFCFPVLYFFIFGGIGLFLVGFDFWELRYLGVGLVGLIYYLYATKRYRSFSFYKSGKIGFLFWSTSLVLFSLLCVIDILAFIEKTGLYWQSISHLIIVLFSTGIIYWRAERKFTDDFKFLNSIKLKKG